MVIQMKPIVVAFLYVSVMSISIKPPWRALETWSGKSFVMAGVIWAIDAALNGSELVADVTIPGAVFGVFIFAALLGTMTGVLGFYRPIADGSPRLALAGAVPIALAGVLALVTIGWVAVAGLTNQSLPPGVLLVVTVALIVLGLLLVGVASVRTDAPSRTCGVLVLGLVCIFLVWLAGVGGLYGVPDWSSAAFGGVLFAFSLAIGYLLRIRSVPSERGGPASDTVT